MNNAKKQPEKAPKLVDPDRLTQTEVARLIGKPTSFLRHRAHLFQRDGDDRYSGRQVFAALLEHRSGDVEPMEFDDATLEFFMQVCRHAAFDWEYRAATVSKLDALIKQHGLAALAAFGGILLDRIRKSLANWGDEHPSQRVTNDRDALEADAAEWVEDELKRAREHASRRAGRVVEYCTECETYGWGRSRRRLPAPPGYLVDEVRCDECWKEDRD